jgi:hypothetical protein
VPFYAIRRSPIAPRTVITLVGYGSGGDGVNGASVPASPSVKRVGRDVIDAAFRDDAGSELLEVYLFDFDGRWGITSRRSSRAATPAPRRWCQGHKGAGSSSASTRSSHRAHPATSASAASAAACSFIPMQAGWIRCLRQPVPE